MVNSFKTSSIVTAWATALLVHTLPGQAIAKPTPELLTGVIGMYVLEMHPYNHPYSARTWTLQDWKGFATGLKALGYNTILIWPMLETMPDPLTESDLRSLELHAHVIDMLHNLGMRALVVLCPNVVPGPKASHFAFKERLFYGNELYIDPRNSTQVSQMILRRRSLFTHLAAADGVVISDGDPGGYPNSGNDDFVSLFATYRQMLDRLRPGIELDYFEWAGWRIFSKLKESGRFASQDEIESDHLYTLSQLKNLAPEPWGIATGSPEILEYARKAGLESRAIAFNYNAIENEPHFPLTNFGDNNAYAAGADHATRGVMGNAETHCLQLPNIFAFVRGALGRPITRQDYVDFAERLIRHQGSLIVSAWESLRTDRPGTGARDLAARLRLLSDSQLELGDLRGLLFGSARRFLNDLALQLELHAALRHFIEVREKWHTSKTPFEDFVVSLRAWQRQHGYESWWGPEMGMPGLEGALRRLHSAEIDDVLELHRFLSDGAFSSGRTPWSACKGNTDPEYARDTDPDQCRKAIEVNIRELHNSYSPRLITAMQSTLARMSNQ